MTADGAVGAHKLILGGASTVLHAILSSCMAEGQQQRIECKDTSKEAMGLLLDLIYTGSTAGSTELDPGVGAFELVHRWVGGAARATNARARLLTSLLSDASFERLGELAVLKGSRDFEQTVAKWGKASAFVGPRAGGQGLVTYSPALRKLLGKDDATAAPASRKRKSF